jgi:hypothetical protein
MERNMAFKVQVGPPQISIHQGQTILISELDGQINWPSDKGLFFRDTRVISNWSISPTLVAQVMRPLPSVPSSRFTLQAMRLSAHRNIHRPLETALKQHAERRRYNLKRV